MGPRARGAGVLAGTRRGTSVANCRHDAMPPRQPGYTLIELMVVVILIAVVTGLAAPQIIEAARNSAQADATNEVVVAFRYARTQAARTSTSQLVVLNLDATPANQLVSVAQGDDNICTLAGATTMRTVSFGDPFFVRNGVQLKSVVFQSAPEVNSGLFQVCITPRGRMLAIVGGVPAVLNGPVQLVVARKAGGGWAGVDRRIIIPANGMPRVML